MAGSGLSGPMGGRGHYGTTPGTCPATGGTDRDTHIYSVSLVLPFRLLRISQYFFETTSQELSGKNCDMSRSLRLRRCLRLRLLTFWFLLIFGRCSAAARGAVTGDVGYSFDKPLSG